MARRMGGEAAALLCLLMLSASWRAAALSLIVTDVECVYEYVYYNDDTVSGNFVVVDHDASWRSTNPGVDFTVLHLHFYLYICTRIYFCMIVCLYCILDVKLYCNSRCRIRRRNSCLNIY